MADNVAITPGSGVTVAADDIGGVQYQRIKLTHGQDGTAVDASAVNPLPVTAPAATRITHSMAVALQTDVLMNSQTALTPKFFSASVSPSASDFSLIAAVSGKKLRILALVLQCSATATDVLFESSTTTRKHRASAGVNGGQVLPFNQAGWFETAAGESLTCTTNAGSVTEITGVYVEI